MRTKTEIIILHETVLQSYLVDSSTFLLFAALIGLGIYLDSAAMQWIGGILGMLTVCDRSMRHSRMTVEQARKRLDEIAAAA
ncbi:hypothetical protein [Rhizobium leucaenae]|uniref:hypothetical protein n=1 Tax=Rhizobium leucaenae TaxID=29450 RepID=UPI00040CF2CF|nr:hypothetical protein [Rhizobium leucaenae]